jgi:hypothetical protein
MYGSRSMKFAKQHITESIGDTGVDQGGAWFISLTMQQGRNAE